MATIFQDLAVGFAHHQRGEWAAAEKIYRQIIASDPNHAEALHLLGALELSTGRIDEAVSLLERAIAIAPSHAVYQANLGSAYLSAHRHGDARVVLEKAIRGTPDVADFHYNLAIAHYNLGRLDDSLASYRRALDVKPEARTYNNLGNLLLELGRTDESLHHLEKAIELDPGLASAHYNRALAWLRQGRLSEGWDEYEWRWCSPEFNPRKFAQPSWDGSALAEKTLRVHSEQGLGDTIQFIRYAPRLRERCPRAIIEIHSSLLPLFTQSGLTGLVALGAPSPPFDVQLPLASLPRVFGTQLDTIPAPVPYLLAQPALIERWRTELSRYSGFKVGIAWQGSLTYREDRFRSIPLPFFAPLARLPGIQLLSLQKGAGVEQIALLRNQFHVVDLGSRIDGGAGHFMDTAAIMKNLDLMITSDTATAHLAGALGIKVWLALRIGPDWRWLADRSDSPWYPTMRLFRQRTFGDWARVFDEMASVLRQLL